MLLVFQESLLSKLRSQVQTLDNENLQNLKTLDANNSKHEKEIALLTTSYENQRMVYERKLEEKNFQAKVTIGLLK